MSVCVAGLKPSGQCPKKKDIRSLSHLFVGVPIDFVSLKHEHVEQGRLAVMKVANYSHIANHFGERHHVYEESTLSL